MSEKSIFKELYAGIMSLGSLIFPHTKDPVEESVKLSAIYEQVWMAIMSIPDDSWLWLVDLYIEEETKEIFAVISREGLLYKAAIEVLSDGVSIGELIQVKEVFEPVKESTMLIKRQSDGSVRWFLIASSNVLNRNAAIDSSQLFDSLIKDAYDNNRFPYLTFYHLDEAFKMGMTDWVAREENLLLASGLFDDSKLGNCMIRAYEEDPSYWGSSISFWPTDGHMETVAENIDVPMYTKGYFEEISILPEKQACCLFTALKSKGKVNRMKPDLIDSIKKLAGDDQTAEEFINNVDEVNREIVDKGLVRRETTTEQSQTETDEIVPTEDGETPAEVPAAPVTPTVEESTNSSVPELEIDEEIIGEIVQQVVNHKTYVEAVGDIQTFEKEIKSSIENLAKDVADLRGHVMKENKILQDKLAKLGKEEEEKKQDWIKDLPRNKQSIAIVRARVQPDSPENKESLEEIAQRTVEILK